MQIKEIICKHWFLPKAIGSICLYPFILYQHSPSVTLIRLSWARIHLMQRMGIMKYYSTYLLYAILYGYEKHPLEIMANNNAYLNKTGDSNGRL